MKVFHRVDEIRRFRKDSISQILGLVPTMGYLHEGHLSLVKAARQECDQVAVSIFVNPTQFGPGEDFERYPRDEERDLAMLRDLGVDAVFTPGVEEMYPSRGLSTMVEVSDPLTGVLCGRSRPGHFRGVATVVAKLFHIFEPDLAFFGQKDAQQTIVIRRMVEDLNFPVGLVIVPTVREPDGLAMSSRNVYLTPGERKAAPVIYSALQEGQRLLEGGESRVEVVVDRVRQIIEKEPLARVDYVELRDGSDLSFLEDARGTLLLAAAVYFGNTRLIDNLMVEV